MVLFNKLNEITGTQISFDVLPAQKISTHLKSVTVAEAVESVLSSYADYAVSEIQDRRHTISVKRITESAKYSTPSFKQSDYNSIMELRYAGKSENDETLFDIDIRKTPLETVLEQLFLENSRYSDIQPGYSLFTDGNTEILRTSARGKNLAEVLNLLAEQVNAKCYFDKDIWYIIPSTKNAVQDSVSDRTLCDITVTTKYKTADEAINFIRNQYADNKNLKMNAISSHTVLISGPVEQTDALKSFIQTIDIPSLHETVTLKYISADSLLEHLPPSVSKSDIEKTGKNDTVFFSGTPERREQFLKELAVLDQPDPLIRYDLLIIQYQKSDDLNWGITGTMRPLNNSDSTVFTGELGNLLNISFDAVSVFGELFSLKLNSAMKSSSASIFADTTLYGLSGEKITFENTNTYRYRDTTTNDASGTSVYSSITREIISGLQLDVSGWVSGDEMVTMTVTASVSKQGVDVSRSTGNPPPTSEKSITTKVRARSGEPVVLSGLTQTEKNETDNGVPFLKKIPVLGFLFKGKEKNSEQTDMVIYLVPHVVKWNPDKSESYQSRAAAVLRESLDEN